jgi:hypothetical protein
MGARAGGIPPIAKVGLNLAAKWFQIAADGERDAWAARAREEEIGDPYDLPAFGDALDAELRAGLVAIAGAAFSIDAVYGLVVDLLPEDARPRFAEGTPRVARIVETLKVALDLGKRQHEWQKAIPALFKLRDPAVHHDGAFYETAPHPVGLTRYRPRPARGPMLSPAPKRRYTGETGERAVRARTGDLLLRHAL